MLVASSINFSINTTLLDNLDSVTTHLNPQIIQDNQLNNTSITNSTTQQYDNYDLNDIITDEQSASESKSHADDYIEFVKYFATTYITSRTQYSLIVNHRAGKLGYMYNFFYEAYQAYTQLGCTMVEKLTDAQAQTLLADYLYTANDSAFSSQDYDRKSKCQNFEISTSR